MIRPLFLALCLTISGMAPFQALAAINSCFASSKASFDVTFHIDQAVLHETVLAQQSGGQRELPLWSDTLNTKLYAVIADDHIERGRNYKVWLKYTHSGDASQKAGMLAYYIWEHGDWRLLQQQRADLSSLHSAKIAIKGLGNTVSNFQCKAPQPPEPPIRNYCEAFTGPAQTWQGNHTQAYLGHKALITGTYVEGEDHYLWFPLETGHNMPGRGLEACDFKSCRFPSSQQPNRWAKKLDLGTFQSTSSPNYYSPHFPKAKEYAQFALGHAKTETLQNGEGHKIKSLSVSDGSTLHLYTGTYWFETVMVSKRSKIVTHGDVVIYTKDMSLSDFSSLSPADGVPDSLRVYDYKGTGANWGYVSLTKGSSLVGLLYAEDRVEIDGGHCIGMNTDTCQVTSITGAVTTSFLVMNSSSTLPSTVIYGKSDCFSPPPAKDYFIDVTPEQDFSLTCDRLKVEFQVTDKEGLPAKGYKGEVDIATSLSTQGKAYWYKQESGGTGSRLDASQAHSLAVDDNGHLALWLKSDKIGKVSVTATLADDKDKSDSGLYNFVPFKFVIANEHLPVVAGRPVDIEIKAMACSSPQSDEVAVGYQGERTLTLATRYDAPSMGRESVELAASKSDDWKTEAIKLDFNQGRAKAQLRYLDAGKTMLTLFDPKCTLDGCEILPRSRRASMRDLGNWQRLEGSQAVWSRPYTFALCNAGGEAKPIQSATGTSAKGNAFVAAGEQFETKAKPVIWLPVDAGKSDIDAQGNARGAVDSSQMCGRPITANFMASGSPGTSVELSIPAGEGIQPHSPRVARASAGQLFVENQSLTNQSLEDTPFSARWSEVGSVLLQADTQADYLGMDMNMGYRPVGRFYPKYFKVVEAQSGTAYPQGQSFVYMDQPFRGMLKVQAQNAQKLPTVNYGYFADKNQVGVEVEAVDIGVDYLLPNRLTDRIDFGGWPKNWGQMWQRDSVIVPDSPLLFGRLLASPAVLSGGKATAPDGPYEVAMGVLPQEMSASECQKVGCPVLAQPNLEVVACGAGLDCGEPRSAEQFARFATRYGRMVLDDVAGRADSDLTIPLRVEYWNGTEFVTNKDDDVSRFDGQYSCRQLLAQSVAIESQSKIEGKGQVEKGAAVAGDLTAIPDPTRGYREQARFWQKLVDANPKKAVSNDPDIACEKGYAGEQSQPWLLFNWRGLGDENPSAVVTFGAYRGNDRIIYRGEKGINGLLN